MNAGNRIRQVTWRCALCAAIVLSLTACMSESPEMPLYDGMRELDARAATEDDLEDIGFDWKEGRTAVYRSNDEVDDLIEYYSDDVEDDGWDVEDESYFRESALIAVLSKKKRVAVVMLSSGYYAQLLEDVMDDSDVELDFDPDDIDFDETFVLLITMTCDEDDVDECVDELELNTSV